MKYDIFISYAREEFDKMRIGNNPLNADAVSIQIPALEARGVTIR